MNEFVCLEWICFFYSGVLGNGMVYVVCLLCVSLSQDSSGTQCLLIDPVVKCDAGWYTVSAINEAGMSTCNARLDVGCK